MYAVDLAVDPGALHLSPDTVWAEGATVRCDLAPGPEFAGHSYRLLASGTGTSPGQVLEGLRIPLDPDLWFEMTMLNDPAILRRSAGTLDASGRARTWLRISPAVAQSFEGPLWLSLVVFDPTTGAPVHTTAPRALRFRP